MLALVIFVRATEAAGLLLLLYRRARARSVLLGVATYLGFVSLAATAIALGDPIFLASGALAFGGGFTVAHDTLFIVAILTIAPVAYELRLPNLHRDRLDRRAKWA
jgi:hypothetical protein